MEETRTFIPGQRIISFSKQKTETREENELKEEQDDKSYDIVKRLHESIYANDFQVFKEIFENEYIDDPTVIDYFKYDEEEHNWWWTKYPLCTCAETEPTKIHKMLNVSPCNCSEGKRYLAYLRAYSATIFETPSTITYDLFTKNHGKKKPFSAVSDIQIYLTESGPIFYEYTHLVYEK